MACVSSTSKSLKTPPFEQSNPSPSTTHVLHRPSVTRTSSVTTAAKSFEMELRSRKARQAVHASAKAPRPPPRPWSSFSPDSSTDRAPSLMHSRRGRTPPPSSKKAFHCLIQ